MREIIKIGLAVVEDDSILLVRKRRTSFYILPGGKPEVGEDDISALCREINEELGCRIDPTAIKPLGTFTDQAAGMPGVRVTVRLYAGKLLGNPTPRAEIEDMAWFRLHGGNTIDLAPSLKNSILPFLFKQPRYHGNLPSSA